MITAAVPNDDLMSAELLADPYPAMAALRESDRIHWSDAQRAWLVTRYDDVVEGFGNPLLSSDRVRPLLATMTDKQRQSAGRVMELLAGWMVVTDPPEHTRLRRLAANAFNPRRVAAMEGRIRGLVDDMLTRFIADGCTDLIADFSFPLPATVIAELLGAPPGDRDRFRHWSEDLAQVAFGAGGAGRPDRHERGMRGLQELLDYFEGLIEDARADPGGENMIAGLLEGDGKGNVLDLEETKAMLALMLFAGHETTTNLIATSTVRLLERPDQLALLREQPDLINQTVEETLRYEGAIRVLIRWVIEDFTWHGKEVRAGQRVFLLLGGANRDPAKFNDPDRLDITRKPNPHVAFGKGVHACIGAQLARVETRIALAAVFERLPGLRVAHQELKWTPSLASRALRSVHVEHDATQTRG
jgi:cytochrome P450